MSVDDDKKRQHRKLKIDLVPLQFFWYTFCYIFWILKWVGLGIWKNTWKCNLHINLPGLQHGEPSSTNSQEDSALYLKSCSLSFTTKILRQKMCLYSCSYLRLNDYSQVKIIPFQDNFKDTQQIESQYT